MKIYQQSIFDLIVQNAHLGVPTHYYSYDTGTVQNSYIAETDNGRLTTEDDKKIAELVEKFLDMATTRAGIKRDNKTAAKCTIPGIDKPVYFVLYDSKCAICFEIDERCGTEYVVPVPAGIPAGGHHGEGDE